MSRLILNATSANPLDISKWINQRNDINESPNYVDGANIGQSKNGKPIFDRINTLYSFSVPLIPIPQSVFQEIIRACEASQMYVRYDSARGNVVERAQASLSGWKYALTVDGVKIYHGCVITIQGAE